jgi:hypothetical protein
VDACFQSPEEAASHGHPAAGNGGAGGNVTAKAGNGGLGQIGGKGGDAFAESRGGKGGNGTFLNTMQGLLGRREGKVLDRSGDGGNSGLGSVKAGDGGTGLTIGGPGGSAKGGRFGGNGGVPCLLDQGGHPIPSIGAAAFVLLLAMAAMRRLEQAA